MRKEIAERLLRKVDNRIRFVNEADIVIKYKLTIDVTEQEGC